MSVKEFRDQDADYLDWVAAHRDGYVINVGRSGRGYARVHRAMCGTITSRPPFTRPYIKVCSDALADLDQWALRRSGTVPERCGICQPTGDVVAGQQTGPTEPVLSAQADPVSEPGMPEGQEWEIEGPSDDQPQVWLWGPRYVPYERLTPGQLAARDALRPRVQSLAAMTGEILHASYAASSQRTWTWKTWFYTTSTLRPTAASGRVPGMGSASSWRPALAAIRRPAGTLPAPTSTG
jgi:hypothetical protein